jgi:hypothetical protein
MRALLIDPENQQIQEVDVDTRDDIVRLVGFETIESDAVGDQGDRLFFDEECFLRQSSGRFQLDTLVPVAGRGVVIGVADDGAFCDAIVSSQDLGHRTKYL